MRPYLASQSDGQTLDAILVGFLAYLAAFYGILEFLNRYEEARKIRSWLGFERVELGTLALWLAVTFKILGLMIGPVT